MLASLFSKAKKRTFENENNATIEYEGVSLSEQIRIDSCENSKITITKKVKQIWVENCKNIELSIEATVSEVVLLRNKNIILKVEAVPSVGVEECENAEIIVTQNCVTEIVVRCQDVSIQANGEEMSFSGESQHFINVRWNGSELHAEKQFQNLFDTPATPALSPPPMRRKVSTSMGEEVDDILQMSFRSSDLPGTPGPPRVGIENRLEVANVHSYFCDVCHSMIPIGDVRYDHRVEPDFDKCEQCFRNEESEEPLELFEPQIVYPTPDVGSQFWNTKPEGCAEVVHRGLQLYPKRPLWGIRSPPEALNYTYWTYEQGEKCLNAFVNGLLQIPWFEKNQSPENPIMVCNATNLTPAHCICSISCMYLGLSYYPLQCVLSAEKISQICEVARPKVIFVMKENEAKLREAVAKSGIEVEQWIVVDTTIIMTDRPDIEFDPAFPTFSSLMAAGWDKPAPKPHRWGKKDIVNLVFTSGSTGLPKGVMQTDDNVITYGTAYAYYHPYVLGLDKKYSGWAMETIIYQIRQGGRAGFVNPENLFDDYRCLRPTAVSFTPAYVNSIYQDFVARVKKLKSSENPPEDPEEVAGAEFADFFGNRCAGGVTVGGGKPSQIVLDFLDKYIFPGNVLNTYASSEANTMIRNGEILPGVIIRLRSIPEMGYDAYGDPAQGEILVHKKHGMFAGYYNDDAKTKESFVEIDGLKYFCTGDVGETQPDGKIKIIDRCKFIFKLAQGEFIQPCSIEDILESSQYVHNCLIFGNAEENNVVALVRPTEIVIEEIINDRDPNDVEVKSEILLNILKFCRSQTALRTWEVPRNIHLVMEEWTSENKMLTPTGKKNRTTLWKRFEDIRNALYLEELPEFDLGNDEGEILPIFASLLTDVLGEKPMAGRMFTEQGGNSLTAAKLIKLAKDKRITLTTEMLFSKTIGQISSMISERSTQTEEINFAEEIKLSDALTTRNENPEGTAILLTGATGFMGPLLLLKLSHAFPDRKIFTLVRAENQEDARDRVIKYNNVEVLCGDLAEPDLGLSFEICTKLEKEVNWIIHSGCWVNMVRPYSTLKAANVMSTKFLATLALKSGAYFTYVSSLSAISDTSTLSVNLGDISNKRIYNGYGQTKAVCELFLENCRQQLSLQLSIIRMGTISGHRETGYYNENDYYNLFLRACISIGKVPSSDAITAKMDWTPVDVVADTIIQSREPVTNLLGDGPTLKEIVEHLAKEGDLKAVYMDEWHKAVDAELPSDHPAYSVRADFSRSCGAPPSHYPITQQHDSIKNDIEVLVQNLLSNNIVVIMNPSDSL